MVDAFCLMFTILVIVVSAFYIGMVFAEIGRIAEIPEQMQLPYRNDRPLMTKEEKAAAMKSGVGAYWFDGMYYVDETLPKEYFR